MAKPFPSPLYRTYRPWKRRIVATILALVIFGLLFHADQNTTRVKRRRGPIWKLASVLGPSAHLSRFTDAAGNSTLGFQRIYALSRGTTWRFKGLTAAADLTGLSIETPAQHATTTERLATFLNAGPADSPRPGKGSATAWLAHLDLLQRVVDEDLATALILEDDVDWDVTITKQMRGVSENLLKFDQRHHDVLQTIWEDSASVPYGKSWDILWIGHCGEDVGPAIKATRKGKNVPLQIWHDSTVIPRSDYTGWAHNAVVELPGFSRAVQPAEGPVCTFAYAVTKAAATKVIQLAGQGVARAFDVRLASLCLNGSLRCITVTPELFHEYVPPIGGDGRIASEVNAANGEGIVVSDDDANSLQQMGSTANIVKSARCQALFESTCLPREAKN